MHLPLIFFFFAILPQMNMKHLKVLFKSLKTIFFLKFIFRLEASANIQNKPKYAYMTLAFSIFY